MYISSLLKNVFIVLDVVLRNALIICMEENKHNISQAIIKGLRHMP